MRGVELNEGLKIGSLIHWAAQNVLGLFVAQVRLCTVSSCSEALRSVAGILLRWGFHTFLAAASTSAVRISSFLGLALSKGLILVRHAVVEGALQAAQCFQLCRDISQPG